MGNSGPKNFLLVDGDKNQCVMLGRAFEQKGFNVALAHDYSSALALAARQPPGYVVLDLKIPGGSGLQLIRELIAPGQHPRILVLTAYASIATAIAAVKLGAHYYLPKPADAEDVLDALQHDPAVAAPKIRDTPLSVARMEWEHIQRILQENHGNVSATARRLGMHRRTLQRKLLKLPVRS